jgi:prepilin-type N-terminal cleavage/methylation domain-containing protein
MRLQSLLIRKAFTLIELLTVIAIIGILAGMVIGITGVVQKKAKIAASKAMYQQWVAAIEQYKTTYGQYPYLNGKFEASSDTIVSLDNTGTVTEFIKCLTGRNPSWDGATALSSGAGGDAAKYNRRGTSFCSFGPESFSPDDPKKLSDRFGNSNIRIVMDTDGNGLVKPTDIKGDPSDYSIDSNGNISARVIIYSLKSDKPAEFQDVLSWQ